MGLNFGFGTDKLEAARKHEGRRLEAQVDSIFAQHQFTCSGVDGKKAPEGISHGSKRWGRAAAGATCSAQRDGGRAPRASLKRNPRGRCSSLRQSDCEGGGGGGSLRRKHAAGEGPCLKYAVR
jgi:hypothetical protein